MRVLSASRCTLAPDTCRQVHEPSARAGDLDAAREEVSPRLPLEPQSAQPVRSRLHLDRRAPTLPPSDNTCVLIRKVTDSASCSYIHVFGVAKQLEHDPIFLFFMFVEVVLYVFVLDCDRRAGLHGGCFYPPLLYYKAAGREALVFCAWNTSSTVPCAAVPPVLRRKHMHACRREM